MKNRTVVTVIASLLLSPLTWAGPITPFNFIRVGDADGFGFSPTAGLVRATGVPHSTPADTNGNGVLQQTEFLPDSNKNGSVATGSGDDFDNRSAAEKTNIGIGGNGFTDKGSSGAKWTDISLSTSFTGPNFPDPGGPGVPNQPSFVYDFNVLGAAVLPTTKLFFNLIFGDYDVVPANVNLTFASAPGRTVALATQPGAADGLIQATSALLDFNEVFTNDGVGGWNGFLKVDFIAPNEPYTAFDFTELSVTQISSAAVPVPPTLPLVGVGLLALAFNARRRSA